MHDADSLLTEGFERNSLKTANARDERRSYYNKQKNYKELKV